MFPDPLTGITVNSVALSLPKIDMRSQGSRRTSVYQTNDQLFRAIIEHQLTQGGRIRSTFRLEQSAVVPDPLTAVNDMEQQTIYTVWDRPVQGFTLAQMQQLTAGHAGALTNAFVQRIYGQES